MITITGGAYNPTDMFSDLSNKLNAECDGEELFVDNHNGLFHLVSYTFFGNCFMNVGQLEANQAVCLKNEAKDQRRVILRIIYEGVSDYNKGKKTNTRNELLLYNSNQSFEHIIPKDNSVKWITLSFPAEMYNFLSEEINFELKSLILKDQAWFTYFSITPDLESLIRTIFESIDNKSIRHSIFLSRIIEIFGLLRLKLDEIKFGVSTGKNAKEIENLIAFKNRLLSDFSISPILHQLADEMHMSESTLQRSFKEVFNMPIIQFFNQKRMEEVHRQIKYTDKSITEIGIDLGFTHIHHLSTAFKKHFGYSPKSLRS